MGGMYKGHSYWTDFKIREIAVLPSIARKMWEQTASIKSKYKTAEEFLRHCGNLHRRRYGSPQQLLDLWKDF